MNPSDPNFDPNQVQSKPQSGGTSTGSENEPQVVYMARPIEPQQQQLSPEAQKRHEESRRAYPKLNLSEGEYIISAMKRHPIGLVWIWLSAVVVVVILFALAILLITGTNNDSSGLATGTQLTPGIVMIPVVLLTILSFIFAFIASYIYNANSFYLTNESVIQHIQTSLFNMREQTISLNNVEDASYSQNGILPHLFNYGLLRLSTQGDETTYRFNYAGSPKKQIAVLNNAVENFKNVRPIAHN